MRRKEMGRQRNVNKEDLGREDGFEGPRSLCQCRFDIAPANLRSSKRHALSLRMMSVLPLHKVLKRTCRLVVTLTVFCDRRVSRSGHSGRGTRPLASRLIWRPGDLETCRRLRVEREQI